MKKKLNHRILTWLNDQFDYHACEAYNHELMCEIIEKIKKNYRKSGKLPNDILVFYKQKRTLGEPLR